MRNVTVAAVLLTAWASACVAQAATAYESALGRFVDSLVGAIPEGTLSKQPRAAVGWFTCASGACEKTRYAGNLGRLLATDVSGRLVRDRRLRVVTREALDDLVKEKDFWLSDMVSGRTVPKARRDFSAFTLLIRGRYFADVRKDTVRVTAEVIEVQTGEKLAAASIMLSTTALPVPPDSKELGLVQSLSKDLAQTTEAVTRIVDSQPQGKRVRVRVWTERRKKVFRKDEKLQFKAAVDRDAYLWLFDVRPDGKTIMIFPNAYHTDNFLRAGKVMTLPGRTMDFEFTVEPPFGPEAVQAVATTSRLVSVEMHTRGGLDTPTDTAEPFRQVTTGTKGLAEVIREVHQRGIRVQPKEKPPAWAEDHWTFMTEE